uniref:Uncharacterized protein n=1 Tax=Florenciella parvula TaxID=236787 RepID=A0A7S2GC48_9STRA|mmetsp:Transcript_63588/g.175390  ORF Transcript_63588/g.175390 Transcript_63588/m.175390 type:complete len:247 (-) Transcript_63588:28-768(-)
MADSKPAAEKEKGRFLRGKLSQLGTVAVLILTNVLKIDLGEHIQALRFCFAMTILFVVMVYENIRPRIKRKALRDKREAEEALEGWKKATSRSRKKSVVKKTHEEFQPHVIAMKSPEWGEDEVETKMTYTEYDAWMLNSKLQNLALQVAITVGMHYKLHYTTPLALQVVSQLLAIYQDHLVEIYIKHTEAEGDLERPWAEDDDPMAAMKKRQEQAAAAAAKEQANGGAIEGDTQAGSGQTDNKKNA